MKKLNQENAPLFEALLKYRDERVYAFHVPGHKHGSGIPEFTDYVGKAIMDIDVNSMEDLDNLANPVGVIKDSLELAADAFGGDYGYFLINGTTSGIQAMIMASTKPNDKIIMPRNAHKSAFSGLILSGAVPVYIYPDINKDFDIALGIKAEEVKTAIENHPDSKAVLVLNPTYYGVTSELKDIIDLAHKKDIAVLCDEAHGSHFYFHPDLPEGGIKLGADISSLSIHKTGGSMTQSSMLISEGKRIDPLKIKSILNLTQSTSASYVLMASLDIARKQLALKGKEMLDKVIGLAEYAAQQLQQPNLRVLTKDDVSTGFDFTKLVVNVSKTGMTGYEVMKRLRKDYNIQLEMADVSNVLAIISLGDNFEDVKYLVDSFKDLVSYEKKNTNFEVGNIIRPEVIVSPRDAFFGRSKTISIDLADGEISAEMIMAYPPGIPMICPGERITKDIIDKVRFLKKQHCQLQGTEDPNIEHIKVLGHA
ncbi:MAG: aminotransferase class I/II-fold pyridoxal phosphate-dependent enzyme [Thermoanaerobacteraceae bacterium]